MTSMAPSNMSPDWISRVVAQNPWTDVGDGNLRTPPLRLGFPHVDEAQKQENEDGTTKMKFSVAGLLQPGCDDMELKNACAAAGLEKWGDQFAGYVGGKNFHTPFKMQDEKLQYEGFVAGLPYFTASGERRPTFVMQNMAPYTGRIYPGMWAFLVVRPFCFETRNKQGVVLKRGIGVGLQSLMFIADDKEFGGSSVDVNKAFAGVSIEANVNPSASFGAGAGQAQQPANPASVFG